jgi:hypothetical protein
LINTIGNKIIEGPRAIFPPESGTTWLEKDVSIYTHYHETNAIQHISLWSDSTMNKEVEFFAPIIRFLHWEKNNDSEMVKKDTENKWPDIRVFLGNIKPHKFEELNQSIIHIQQLISSIQFRPLGISLKREVAELDTTDSYFDYEIWLRNGAQSFSLYSPLLKDDIFSNKVRDLKQLMLESMDKIDISGWKERYNSPFDTVHFDWDYIS